MQVSFPQWLKLKRQAVDLTQAELAEAVGVRHQTISGWEKGKATPALDPEQTKALFEALGVTFDELLEGYRGNG